MPENITETAWDASNRAYEGKYISDAEAREIGRCIENVLGDPESKFGELLWAAYSAKYTPKE